MRAKEVKPRELVKLSLRPIEALGPQLNAFRATLADEALAAADALTDLERPLARVPVGMHDDLPVAGQALTKGSRSYGQAQAADAEALRWLRASVIPKGSRTYPLIRFWIVSRLSERGLDAGRRRPA